MRAERDSGIPVFLGLFAFWAGLLLAGHNYPGGYDWPYTTISSLVYAERNPSGFLWARSGMAVCGVLGWYWSARLVWSRRQWAALPAAGIRTVGIGYLCLTCCALLPEQSFPIPKGHDSLALAAFLSLTLGTVLISFAVVYPSARQRQLPGGPWLYAGVLGGLAFAPVLLAAIAQAYVTHALPGLPWVSPVWRARGVPVRLSFAFWEWVTCAVLTLYLAVLSRTTACSAHR